MRLMKHRPTFSPRNASLGINQQDGQSMKNAGFTMEAATETVVDADDQPLLPVRRRCRTPRPR